MLPHRGLVAVSRMFAEVNEAGPEDVWINPMPMFHTAGCGLATLGALQTGGTHVLPPGFDPVHMLDLFQAERGTLMLSVPTMLIRMLDEQAARPRDVSSWRLSMLGGAPVAPELVRRPANSSGSPSPSASARRRPRPTSPTPGPTTPTPAGWRPSARLFPGPRSASANPAPASPFPSATSVRSAPEGRVS